MYVVGMIRVYRLEQYMYVVGMLPWSDEPLVKTKGKAPEPLIINNNLSFFPFTLQTTRVA